MDATESAEAGAKPGAWLALGLLTAMNLLNYVDRFVVPAVQESIKHSELALSDAQIGFLATGFLVVYMITAPVFAALARRFSRIHVIALGVALWSVSTALAGVAHSYPSLLAARATVGVGEAAYGTIAPALLADLFPESWRGRVFAVFYMAIPVGGALGFVLGGLADHHFGWRRAFFIIGLPGLLLALAALLIRDPERGSSSAEKRQGASALRELFHQPTYGPTIAGYAAYTFAVGGMGVWMASFLARERHVPLASATFQIGIVLVGTGFVGTFLGGWVADLVHRRIKRANLLVSGVTTLLAAPLTYVAFASPDMHVFWGCLIAAEVLIFASTGPINAEIVSGISPSARALAMALSIFVIHCFGDVPSPWLIGIISDRSSLARAIMIIPFAVLAAGVIWTVAGRIRSDT